MAVDHSSTWYTGQQLSQSVSEVGGTTYCKAFRVKCFDYFFQVFHCFFLDDENFNKEANLSLYFRHLIMKTLKIMVKILIFSFAGGEY